VGLLDGATGKVLESRARAVLDLAELQHLAGPSRTWVSREDWTRVWGHGRGWGAGWESPKQALMRFNRLLEKRARVSIVIETLDGEHRIHVATAELRELVALEQRRARIVDECARAKREGREPELSWLDADPNPSEVTQDYWVRKKHLGTLSTKYGVGQRRLKKILEGQRAEIREKRRMRIAERAPAGAVERALRVHDDGGSLRDVARVLGCNRPSALRFLRSSGRDTKPAKVRRPPPPAQPPRSPVAEESGACEQWATCEFPPTSKPARVSA
jgi:hypothetical protein